MAEMMFFQILQFLKSQNPLSAYESPLLSNLRYFLPPPPFIAISSTLRPSQHSFAVDMSDISIESISHFVCASDEEYVSSPSPCAARAFTPMQPQFNSISVEQASINLPEQECQLEQPEIGMEFPTDDAAYDFYNKYAYRIGFSIRKDNVRKNKSKFNTMRIFTCSKAGCYRNRSKGDKPRKRKPALDMLTDCKARMKINICKKGLYTVTSFEPAHNHPLTTPSKRKLLNSHKGMNDSEKAIAKVADAAGLKPLNSSYFETDTFQ